MKCQVLSHLLTPESDQGLGLEGLTLQPQHTEDLSFLWSFFFPQPEELRSDDWEAGILSF